MQVLKRNLAKIRGGWLPKKICNFQGCHNTINYTETYCEKHKKTKTERHKTYDEFRRNKKSAEFYHTDEWTKTREVVLNNFNHIDIYAYYVEHKILAANIVHHVIELNDDWTKKLNLDNLIPVSDISHKMIHKAYKNNKTETQKLLFELRDKWISEFLKG